MEEMSKIVSQVDQLRDQLEEYTHTEEKLHKMENAIEKYKKRLEDSADLKRQIKVCYDGTNMCVSDPSNIHMYTIISGT
jgi:protein HOOK3